jgi:DNA mismatch endonuclease, patch repair protein
MQVCMRDRLSKERRSWNMSRIRGRDTTPEKVVRSILPRMGHRFRLHGKKLPGWPDIVLPKHKTVVFVHGCFWHRHRPCNYSTT